MQELIRQRITEIVGLHRGQFFLWCPVFLSFGIIAYFSLRFEPALWVSAPAWILGLGAFILCRRYMAPRAAIILLLMSILGFTAAQIRTQSVYTPILKKKIAPVAVEGRIESLEHLGKDSGFRLVLSDVEIERLSPEETPRKIRVKLSKEQDLVVGQRVQLLAGLNPPSPPALPGGFDFQRFMFFKSVGAVGFSYGPVEVIEDAVPGHFDLFIEELRHKVTTRILAHMHAREGGVASALMVGQRRAIVEDDQQAMRDAGLAHMLAISGLHIGLFSGVVFFFARFVLVALPGMALKYPVKKIAAVLAIFAGVFYMLIAGMTIPTQRAMMMTGIVFLAIILDRSPLSLRLVAFAALVVLLFSPESLLSASFQMSFSAVAGLIAFYSAIQGWWRAQYSQAGIFRRAALYVLGVVMTTVIATLATAPFALFHFQKLAVYAVAGNILAMPVLSFAVMPLSVIAYALMPLGLEGFVLGLMDMAIGLILQIAHFVADLQYAVLRIPLMPVSALICFTGGFVLLILLRGWLRSVSLVFLITALLFILNVKKPFMLISSDFNLLAYQDQAEQLYVSSRKANRFKRGIWEASLGLDEDQAVLLPKEGEFGDGGEDIRCAELGCRFERGGHKIAYLRETYGFLEECAWADVILMPEPAPSKCEDVRVIDRFDVYYRGAHALYDEGERLRIKSVNYKRGKRPWVAAR